MALIELTTGQELLDTVSLKAFDWYVYHDRCPLSFNKNEDVRFNTLNKAGHIGPKGDSISRVRHEGPIYLNPVHRVQAVREKSTNWWKHGFEVPNGVIFKLVAFEHHTRFGALRHSGALYFRVRETAPYIRVSYKSGYGLDYLVKGRLDRLSPDYVISKGLIKNPMHFSQMNEAAIDQFLNVEVLMPALREMDAVQTETIHVDGQRIEIPKNKKVRRINSL